MNTLPNKKARCSNYSNSEKSDLCTIVADFKDTIENKKSDAITWRDKESAWKEISDQFNALSPNATYRSAESLKKCYENIKQATKKQFADEKFEIKKTGGGRGKNVMDPVYEKAMAIMNVKTVKGLQNTFDSDTVDISENNLVEDFSIEMLPVVTDEEYSAVMSSLAYHGNKQTTHKGHSSPGIKDKDSSATSADWQHYTPAELKKPVNKKLRVTSTEILSPSEYIEITSKSQEANNLLLTNKKLESMVTNSSKKPTKNSKPSKSSQRRPGIIGLSSTDLAKEYSDLANMKLLIAQEQLKIMQSDAEAEKIERAKEDVEHNLRKKSLELDIEIKKLQSKRLKDVIDA